MSKYYTTSKRRDYFKFNQLILAVITFAVFSTHADELLHHATKQQPRRSVQDQVCDTVVQVFSQVAEFDSFQPPQFARCGSGFFINDGGEIVTNDHVIDQAVAVWVQIPSLGKGPIKANIVGTCPDKDLALLRLDEKDLELIKKTIGRIPYLPLGDSDDIHRADEVLALGYLLGQESLKSTTGIINGREQHLIQMSAPISYGSAGGPLLNVRGEVIGVNSSSLTGAQNVNYAIPINDLKVILPDLRRIKVLRKTFLGFLSIKVTDDLTAFLGNPLPGGGYAFEVVKNSPLEGAGVKSGDMIYEVNGNRLDIYGEMSVPWSEDKVSITDYVNRLAVGEEVHLVTYRNSERKELTFKV